MLCCFARFVPLLAVLCPRVLSVALWSCAFGRCALWFSPRLCALCCVCLAVVCRCVLLFAAVLFADCVCCVCPGVLCCAFPVLSALCGAVPCCAGVLPLCCSCGLRCLCCLVLWCVAVCCAVAVCCPASCGVLWRGAGSVCPRLTGGVFQCRGPCLAVWPASLWLVWFAVVPCSPVFFFRHGGLPPKTHNHCASARLLEGLLQYLQFQKTEQTWGAMHCPSCTIGHTKVCFERETRQAFPCRLTVSDEPFM